MKRRPLWLSWLMFRMHSWWVRFRRALPEYEKRNLAEWRYWGTRRAERDVKGLRFRGRPEK